MNGEASLCTPVPTQSSDEADGMTVLVVDDEAHVRAFLRTAFRGLGVQTVYEAANGAEGVEMFEQLRPTLVVLDVSMPVMPGQQAAREILARDPDAAVVIVTADARHETVKEFARIGVMGYVLKHRPAEEVRTALAEFVGAFAAAE